MTTTSITTLPITTTTTPTPTVITNTTPFCLHPFLYYYQYH